MKNKLIYIYLAVFLLVLIVLRTVGLAHFNNYELFSYIIISYGLSLFYQAYLTKNKFELLIGSIVFLAGVVFFVIGNFEFTDIGNLLIPSLILIAAFSLFMLYIYDPEQRALFYISVVLILSGVVYIWFISKQGYSNFLGYMTELAKLYWPVVILLGAAIIFVNKGLKK